LLALPSNKITEGDSLFQIKRTFELGAMNWLRNNSLQCIVRWGLSKKKGWFLFELSRSPAEHSHL